MSVVEKQVFLRRGTKLPDQLQIHGSAMDADWLTLSGDAYTVDKQVRAANWHFFWLTEHVDGWAIAAGKEAAAEAALRKALKQVAATRNAAEVLSVSQYSLFGWHYCRVRLSARHIQHGPILNLTPSVGLISPALKPERLSSFPDLSQEAAA